MARKQTSSRISTLAARVLNSLDYPKRVPLYVFGLPCGISVGEVRALAASALSQDETKGNAKPKKRAKRKQRKA